MREVLHGHRLQPDLSRAGERREEDAVASEECVLDAWNGGDVELHRFLVHAHVAWMHAQRVTCLKVVRHDLAMQLDPCLTLTLQALHAEPGTAEHACTQPLLK